MDAGDRPGAEGILRKLMKDHKSNKALVDRVQSILDIPLPHHQRILITEKNRQGKKQYDEGDYESAISSFREALSLYSQHPAINLNACVSIEKEHPEYNRKEAFGKYLETRLKK